MNMPEKPVEDEAAMSDDDGPPDEMPIAKHQSGMPDHTDRMFEFLGFNLGGGQTQL